MSASDLKRRGASLLSYGLMVGLVAVVALASVTSSGSSVTFLFDQVAGRLDGVGSSAGGGGSDVPDPDPTASPLPVLASCDALLSAVPSLAGQDGNYTIDPDGSGGVAAFTAYCDMTQAGGGLTLVGAMNVGNYNPSKTTGIALTDTNNVLPDAEWVALRDATGHLLMTVSSVPGWVRTSNAVGHTANCADLSDLTPDRTTRVLDRYHYAHNENAGCEGTGGDYCYISYDPARDGVGALRSFNQCSVAPDDYAQVSTDGLSWSTPSVSGEVHGSNDAQVWVFVK